MRSVYLVAYDVSSAQRLRKTYRLMCGMGDPLQYSVFRCELSAMEKQSMLSSLSEILNLSEDRVMLVNLGPVGARGDECVEFWGKPRSTPSDGSAVVV